MANKRKEIVWHDEKRKLKDIFEWDKNPRKSSPKQRADLAESLRLFGVVEPIVINTDNILIGGHARVHELRRVHGKEYEVAVRVPDHTLNPDEVAELNIRLNKNQMEFDKAGLAELDPEMLRRAGWEDEEIRKIFDRDKEDIASLGEQMFATELREENNYIVFAFDDELDWQMVEQEFDLKSVEALDSKGDYRRKGVGRVLKGSELLKRLGKK